MERQGESPEDENARLREEIRVLKEKLAVYEDADPSDNLDDKHFVEKMFKMFDTDKNNYVDAKEFQQLAFQLGETMTQGEVDDAIKQIDADKDGVISFDEFYAWWNSALPIEAEIAAAESKDKSKDKEKSDGESALLGEEAGHALHLKVLKMKLRSRSYMRSVTRLIERVNAKATLKDKDEGGTLLKDQRPLATTLPSSSDKGKSKEINVPEKRDYRAQNTVEVEQENVEQFRVQIGAEVGSFNGAACDATVDYVQDEPAAVASRTRFGVDENACIIEIAFTVNEGIDEFELGELSGGLKDIFGAIKEEVKFHSVQIKMGRSEQDANQPLFIVTIVFDLSTIDDLSALPALLQALQISYFRAEGACSHAPLDADPGDFVRLKGRLNAVIANTTIDFFQALTGEHEDPTARGQLGDVISLLTTLKNVDVNLRFDDVGSLLRQALKTTNLGNLRGWQSVKEVFRPILQEYLGDKEVPPALVSAYAAAKTCLLGVSKAQVQLGDGLFTMHARAADVVGLLPSCAELNLQDY